MRKQISDSLTLWFKPSFCKAEKNNYLRHVIQSYSIRNGVYDKIAFDGGRLG